MRKWKSDERIDLSARALRNAALGRRALPSDTARLAQYLLGKIVVRTTALGMLSGRIVETEAYPPGDAAGHAFHGETPRNHSLFLSRGHAYVYLAYGTSYMLNVSSEVAGVGAGVLIRALEPLSGIASMRRNRGVQNLGDLMRGPGRLTRALEIDRRLDGADLCVAGPLWLARDTYEPPRIGTSVRIGLTRAPDRRLRFFIFDSRFLSGPKKLSR